MWLARQHAFECHPRTIPIRDCISRGLEKQQTLSFLTRLLSDLALMQVLSQS